ncbi:hypothetical protein [Alteriqipengyuania sp. 357]
MHAPLHAAPMGNNYPLSDTPAARMLSEGLARAKEEQGLSVRQIGKIMGYKTAVVLSHMALGRVPIPIDRTMELADILKLDKRAFLQAVVRQRHPEVQWELLSGNGLSSGADTLVMELQAALGASVGELSREQRSVMREVAAERSPRRRWLSVHELHVVEVLRELFPHMACDGVDPSDLEKIKLIVRDM